MNGQIFYTEYGFPVDTLFLKSLPKDMRDDDLFNHFSTFGNVRSVRTYIHATDSSGFVQFQEAEVTAKVLRIKHHLIDGHKVHVEIARTWHHNVSSTAKDDLPLESTNLTGTMLMDLNDDCLREILARAAPMTLCSLLELSENCKNNRLKAITIETFARKYKTCQLNQCAPTVDKAHRLLANFGPLISNLVTAEYYAADKTMSHAVKSIGQFCSGTVTSLCLVSYTFDKTDAKALKVLFNNLEKLALYFCHFERDAMDLLAHCESLVEIDLSDDGFMGHHDKTVYEALFQHTFPNLEVFTGDTTSYKLKNFISRHKKLKTLSLSLQDHSDLLPTIADNCSELKILVICTGRFDSYPVQQGNSHYYPIRYKMPVTRIASLKHLEFLQIAYVQNPLECIQQLHHLESLKELIFESKCGSSRFMSALSQLKTLEMLHFFCSDKCVDFTPLAKMDRLKDLLISSSHGKIANLNLVYMVSRLTNLEKFHIYMFPDFEIDDKTNAELVDARSKMIGPRRKLEIMLNRKLFNI
ncbi:uncharacterized protein LOC119084081 [Bradysia coprophila]|uniref:uncharacterized protein LOC119084081 n=1 Tax=Bradysia coprophila TaxID=38358 RepID=UPI00187DA571|nr:uncharacterized protein LOC119084081 [Bradysia coprophila]